MYFSHRHRPPVILPAKSFPFLKGYAGGRGAASTDRSGAVGRTVPRTSLEATACLTFGQTGGDRGTGCLGAPRACKRPAPVALGHDRTKFSRRSPRHALQTAGSGQLPFNRRPPSIAALPLRACASSASWQIISRRSRTRCSVLLRHRVKVVVTDRAEPDQRGPNAQGSGLVHARASRRRRRYANARACQVYATLPKSREPRSAQTGASAHYKA